MPGAPSTEGSVLLSFEAQNVRSFRRELKFSLIATSLAEERVKRSISWREGGHPMYVLPAAGVFGANASGKSNLLRALSDMRELVLHSFRLGSPTGGMPHRPFLLDASARDEPSRFEIDLILNGTRHEYGFEMNSERVLREWAVRYPHGRGAVIFRREGDEVTFGSTEKSRGRAVLDLLRPNALFLSTAASAGHPRLLPLYAWFERNLRLAEAQSRERRQALTTTMLDDPDRRDRVLTFLQAADLGITGATRVEIDPDMKDRLERAVRIIVGEEGETPGFDPVAAASIDAFGVMLRHRGAGKDMEFRADDESLGTLVWFGLVGPIIQTLSDGAVFLADELDASLHPGLVHQVIELFQSPETNPRRAQLVFNSHDTTVLGDSVSERLLGRDQIWFTEKLDSGETRLYPLTDLEPRKDEAIERRYLAGRYGATPLLSSYQFHQLAELITDGKES